MQDKLSIAEVYQPKPKVCPAVSTQSATVCLPVSLKPYAKTGEINVKCNGAPIVVCGCSVCKGTPEGCCEFTISQKITVDIPVEFGADVNIGKVYTDCGKPCTDTMISCECAKYK